MDKELESIKDKDFVPSSPHMPNFSKSGGGHSKKKLWVIFTICLVALLIGGAAVWWFVLRDKPQPKTEPTKQTTQQEPTLSAEEAATPQSFKSTKLNIEFIHRTDWKVTESSDKSEVIVTSPKVTYAKPDGSTAEDVFTIKMRNGVIPEATQATVIKAVAVRDSVVIAYDHPATEQRQYTNITDAGKDANTFNFIAVSGSTAYKAGQAIGYGINLTGQAYMFAGGFGPDADDALVFNDTAKSELDGETYTQALNIIKSLKIY